MQFCWIRLYLDRYGSMGKDQGPPGQRLGTRSDTYFYSGTLIREQQVSKFPVPNFDGAILYTSLLINTIQFNS